jgi:hypothetical protein
MRINEHGEYVYSEVEARELSIARKLIRDTYKTRGQNTARTLVDVMNVMLTRCPMNGYAVHTTVTNKGSNLSFIKDGSELIFQVNDCPNIECCYEELFEFIIQKAFPL